MLLAKLYLPDDTVMVAETLEPTCSAHQLLGFVSPSFVSGDLQLFDCSMRLVLMGTI
jgi:hypothetical protein